MSCCASEEEIMASMSQPGSPTREMSVLIEGGIDRIINLERGGCLVKTKMGNVQLGMPPETVKDSLNLGMTVPTYYIIPTTKFDRKFGLNVAEFEFPAYFNFFVLRKRVTLICDAFSKASIEQVFQETLLGPHLDNIIKEEYHATMEPDQRPDFGKEMQFFAKNPFNPTQPLTCDLLINFILYDENGKAELEQGVWVQKEAGTFAIFEDGELVARLRDKVKVRDKRYDDFLKEKHMFVQNNKEIGSSTSISGAMGKHDINRFFRPPKFGVTVLGASHGFDPKGSTSGYVLWINKRGILVDPPPFSSYILKKGGIPHNLIDKMIITHCHADHDAGSFQKVLFASQIEVLTTPTIMGSFLRKYSALTQYSVESLKKLFIFKPAMIGHCANIHGAKIRFFYSFHTIPCIGFEVFFEDKSLYFSGDTFYDPKKLEELYKSGVFKRGRFEALNDVNWSKYDIILHEAGVPPIHTPMAVLNGLPPSIKEKLYLVHVAAKDVPANSGLRIAQPGLENTIILEVEEHPEEVIFDRLDLIASIDLFNEMPLKKARDLLRCSYEEHYLPGQYVIKEGTLGEKFYIIAQGIVRIFNKEFEKYGFISDYFGEAALTTNSKRNANVIAVSNVTVLVIERLDFLFIFGLTSEGDPDLLDKFKNLASVRKSSVLSVLSKNSHLGDINESQKTLLQMVMKECSFEKGSEIWKKGEDASFCILIISGQVKHTEGLPESSDSSVNLKAGAMVGDFAQMLSHSKCLTTLEALKDVVAYKISSEDLVGVLHRAPGISLFFQNCYFVV